MQFKTFLFNIWYFEQLLRWQGFQKGPVRRSNTMTAVCVNHIHMFICSGKSVATLEKGRELKDL